MDSLWDFLDAVPVVPVCRGLLLIAAVLMLATWWQMRRRRVVAGILAVSGLVLGIGAAVRLATWKELTPCQKYLVACQHYDRVALRELAAIIHRQYPRHQVVALLPPGADLKDPGNRVNDLAAALGPSGRVVGAVITSDDHTLDELMDSYKKTHPQIPRAMVRQTLNDYFNDWYRPRHYVQAIESTGLKGDIVVVAFAGLPRQDAAGIRAAGYPVLLPPGIRGDIAGAVGDGTVQAAILTRPGRSGEIRCFHNQAKAFAQRWVLVTPSTLEQARQIPNLFPEIEEIADPVVPAKK